MLRNGMGECIYSDQGIKTQSMSPLPLEEEFLRLKPRPSHVNLRLKSMSISNYLITTFNLLEYTISSYNKIYSPHRKNPSLLRRRGDDLEKSRFLLFV